MTSFPQQLPAPGNAAAGLADFLGSLGIVSAAQRGSVEHTVTAELARLGLHAQVHELRWGNLVLSATVQQAQLLRYDLDNLRRILDERHPGAVRSIRVRVSR